MEPQAQPTLQEKERTKIRVAFISVLAAVFLTGMKLVVGLKTGSLGILSEALHSGLDLVAALMTLFAVRIADKPADSTHHYGHGKIESLSALIEILLLLITCGFIIYEAVQRMIGKAVHIDVNIYAFAVMAISIVIDFSRSRALSRVAKKYQSQALEADALHFSSDIWSSLVVIFGLIAYRYFHFPLADSLAALIVAVLVIVVSIRLGRRSVDMLMDKAPIEVQPKIQDSIEQIEAVKKIEALRMRTSGAQTFVDTRIILDAGLTFEKAHQIAMTVEQKISELIPGADVMVHADPAIDDAPEKITEGDVTDLLNTHQDLFIGYHQLSVIHHENQHIVNMHLVLKKGSLLDEVHTICDHLENHIKQKIPGVTVTIHAEPCPKNCDVCDPKKFPDCVQTEE